MVALAFGDKQVMCLYDHEKRSYIRTYNFDDCLKTDTPKEINEIQSSADYLFTRAVWGPKNETIIISTTNGKVIEYNLSLNMITNEV
jgi:hypothetical protein